MNLSNVSHPHKKVSGYAALMLITLLTLLLVLSACGDNTPTPAATAATTAASTTTTSAATTTTAATTTAASATTTAASSTAAATTTSGASATTTSAASSSTGGANRTLVVGTDFSSKNLDPGQEYTETAFMVFHSIYQTLVTYKGSDVTKVVPDLAASWTTSADGKTYTFKLDPSYKFANGDPVTANDVVFSYKRLQNLQAQPAFVTANMTDFAAPDPQTFVITLKNVSPDTLSLLTTPSFAVLDAKVAQANGATDGPDANKTDKALTFLNTTSIGSGPFVLTSYTPNQEIDLAKNPNYPNTVNYDKVIIKDQPDANVQQASLAKGDTDFAIDIGADQAKALQGNSGVTVQLNTSLTVFFLMMNVDPTISAPTAKTQVRQAIRYALNYSDYLDLGGQGSIQPPSVIPIGLAGALDKSADTPTDLNKAKDLLSQAGYPNGFTIKMSYPSDLTQNGVKFETMAQKVQADLAQVGITVTLVPMTTQVWLDAYRAGKEPLTLSLWSPDYNDPSDYLTFFPGQKLALRAQWKAGADPAIEDLAAKAAVELDQNTRISDYQQAQKLLNQDGPFAPFLQPAQATGFRSNVKGFSLNPVWVVAFNDTSKS